MYNLNGGGGTTHEVVSNPYEEIVNNARNVTGYTIDNEWQLMVDGFPTDCVYNGEDHTWIATNITVMSALRGEEIPKSLYETSITYNTEDHTNVTGTIVVNIKVTPKISGVVINMNPTTRYYQITPANITVTVGEYSKYQGQADPSFKPSYTGAVKDEIPGWTGQISRQAGEAPGDYPILQGTLNLADGENGFVASNYTLVVISGILHIKPADTGGDGGDGETPPPPPPIS